MPSSLPTPVVHDVVAALAAERRAEPGGYAGFTTDHSGLVQGANFTGFNAKGHSGRASPNRDPPEQGQDDSDRSWSGSSPRGPVSHDEDSRREDSHRKAAASTGSESGRTYDSDEKLHHTGRTGRSGGDSPREGRGRASRGGKSDDDRSGRRLRKSRSAGKYSRRSDAGGSRSGRRRRRRHGSSRARSKSQGRRGGLSRTRSKRNQRSRTERRQQEEQEELLRLQREELEELARQQPQPQLQQGASASATGSEEDHYRSELDEEDVVASPRRGEPDGMYAGSEVGSSRYEDERAQERSYSEDERDERQQQRELREQRDREQQKQRELQQQAQQQAQQAPVGETDVELPPPWISRISRRTSEWLLAPAVPLLASRPRASRHRAPRRAAAPANGPTAAADEVRPCSCCPRAAHPRLSPPLPQT